MTPSPSSKDRALRPGLSLAHRLDGPERAPLLVLGPSLGTTLEVWDPQLEALAASWRVLRYDLPGHGGSAPATEATLDLLADAVLDLVGELTGEERFAIGGISLGGAVAATVAARVPGRVTHLVLCCSSARFGEPGPWLERAEAVRRDGMKPLADVLPGRWFASCQARDVPEGGDARAGGPGGGVPGTGDPGGDRTASAVSGDVARVLRMPYGTDAGSYAACCEAIAGYDLTGGLGAITAPTLVVAGADDPATPVGHAVALATGIAGALLAVVPEAAHLANVEQAATVTAAIVRHLGGDAAARGTRTRRQVLGDAHVDRAAAATTDFTRDFQDLITRYAWDEIWNRPGLDRRVRSCVTLTALVAGGHLEELAMHVRAALRNGLTPEEIKEVLLQTAIYCGVPAANAAFAVAQRTLAETG
ncbi:4-carboxymuconolactone decarboxylase [Streptosporangium carneum]|uniref:3-oxoadipate enol-lactonase n=1 Tax=Streptosporangium carneum TaxID=47481 RepID=A0A9W6I5V1_9ACTN|nr:4-carboxymuconolactone decarboxylase [Streptosporangium carneum]GLK12243.1 3-oxoadipate enol-lactonase [Streptosporangium carneum]